MCERVEKDISDAGVVLWTARWFEEIFTNVGVMGVSKVVHIRILCFVFQGCARSPCLNGGTCVDTCEDPYYKCICPSDKQGQNCGWNIGKYTAEQTSRSPEQFFDLTKTSNVSCAEPNVNELSSLSEFIDV